MSKHAPGPWLMQRVEADTEQYEIGLSRIEFCNGLGGLREGYNGYFHTQGCMSIHDARLIAAAPDLLATAEAARDLFQAMVNVIDPADLFPHMSMVVIEQRLAALKVAIAKAKGDTP